MERLVRLKGSLLPSDAELLMDGPDDARRTVVLAHGAGAAMDAPFMNYFAAGLAERGFRAVRFEFPYMATYRKTGQRKPPDRELVLRETWLNVVAKLGHDGLVIGGKSMGGRIASLIADQTGAAGLVCLGYPFHPVGKPDQLRVEHLRTIETPTLIVQGERDPFGNQKEVAEYTLSPTVHVKLIKDGDHSFKPRKSSGVTELENLGTALHAIVEFLEGLSAGKTSKHRKQAR